MQIAIWTLVAFALLLLLARIAINSHAPRRLQVADGFATVAFALLAINGVCLLLHEQKLLGDDASAMQY